MQTALSLFALPAFVRAAIEWHTLPLPQGGLYGCTGCHPTTKCSHPHWYKSATTFLILESLA